MWSEGDQGLGCEILRYARRDGAIPTDAWPQPPAYIYIQSSPVYEDGAFNKVTQPTFCPTMPAHDPYPFLRIAIVGGGPGGLATAIALSKIPHVHVAVYEQASVLREVGAGISIGKNCWNVLRLLGVAESLTSGHEARIILNLSVSPFMSPLTYSLFLSSTLSFYITVVIPMCHHVCIWLTRSPQKRPHRRRAVSSREAAAEIL